MHTVWTTAELLCMKAVDLICQGNRSNQGVYTRRKWSVFNFYRVFFVTLGHALCETMRNRLCMVCVCVSKTFWKGVWALFAFLYWNKAQSQHCSQIMFSIVMVIPKAHFYCFMVGFTFFTESFWWTKIY